MRRTRFVQWMQKSSDQINVRVHRAVLRHKRCEHSAVQFARFLSGN